jgi:hypothetical protein
MVVKKKIIQKGGQLHNEIFTDYFKNVCELVHYLTKGTEYTNTQFNEKLDSINSELPNPLFHGLIDKLKKKIGTKNKLVKQIKRNLFLIIFKHIVKFFDHESFIAKLLNTYIYMLFINYLIHRTENGRKKNDQMSAFIYLIAAVHHNNFTRSNNNNSPDFNESYYENMNKKLNTMKKSFSIPEDFSRDEFLRRIKYIFTGKYSIRVPILYGNDYVGNLSKKNKKYIINPVGAFILKLYKSDIPGYKRRLLQLLQSVIGSDKIPNLKFLPMGTEFCIIKEENHEKICEQVSSCSSSRFSNLFRNSLYGNKMIAEIKEENIASDEHILELLDILLSLYIENNEKILRTNVNLNNNERDHFNLSQRRPKTLSNQRRQFAEGAQSKVLPNNNE